MRNLGVKGESYFENLCGDSDISVNKVGNDNTGWDFFVEFPLKQDSSKPVDLHPFPIKSLFQVKATDGTKKSIPIKLSNWNNLVKSPLPAFIIVFEFEGKTNPTKSYLIHVDSNLISKVFKRLRKLDNNQFNRLHKFTMNISYHEKNLLAPLNGKTLKNEVLNTIDNSLESYSLKKQKIISSVGYDNGKELMQFHLKIPESYKGDVDNFLVDHSLGLIDKIEVDSNSFFDIRFGIPYEIKSESNQFKSIAIIPEATGKAEIKISNNDHTDHVIIFLDTYLPQGITHLVNPNSLKVLFKDSHVQLVSQLYAKDSVLHFYFPHQNSKVPIKDIKNLGSLLSFFLRNKNEKSFIKSTKLKDKFDSEGKIILKEKLPEELLNDGVIFFQAYQIINHFDYLDIATIIPNELLQQKDNLKIVSMLLSPGAEKFEFSGLEASMDEVITKEVCTPAVKTLKFGDYYFIVSFTFHGILELEKETNTYKMITNDYRLKNKKIIYKDTFDKSIPLELYNSLANEIEETPDLILIENHE